MTQAINHQVDKKYKYYRNRYRLEVPRRWGWGIQVDNNDKQYLQIHHRSKTLVVRMDLVARAPPAWINAMAGMGNGGNAYVSALGVFGSFYGPIGTSLGLVSAIIGLITASKANQPKEHWGGTIVRMQAGLDQPPGYGFPVVSNAGGDVPVMIGFNFRGEYVGDSKRIDAANANYLHEGAFTDINIPHVEDKKTQQVPLLQVLAGDNAVCVAYLGVVWADDTKLGWLGDMGYWCGGEWSYSKIIVGEDDGDKKRVPSKFML